MFRSINKLVPIIAITILPLAASAANITAEAGAVSAGINVILTGLISLIVVLLLAIGVLGYVLVQLAQVYKSRLREERNSNNAGIIKTLLMVVAVALPTVYANAQNVPAEAANVAGSAMIAGISSGDFYFLMGIIMLEVLVILSLLLTMRVIVKSISGKYSEESVEPAMPKAIRKPFWDRFNKTVPIEDEKDILLDHNYDGIQELDNSLPPWWKYGFYLTIVVAIVYFYYYHAGSGPSSYQEYVAEVEEGESQKAAYLAKSANKVDENTVVMLDASGIAAGQTLFQNSCAACHMKDGGGGVGPNLTDDYWLHGGSLKDVFATIKYGWPDKGMKSWKDDFSPKQIAELTSFIKTLRGTTPAVPKEKQGELYNENSAPALDSAKAVATN